MQRAAEAREADLRQQLQQATAAEHSSRLAMQDRERVAARRPCVATSPPEPPRAQVANEQRGRAYVLEEELKKQRKRMDEYVLEEKKRLEEERGRREAEARDRERRRGAVSYTHLTLPTKRIV